MLQDELFLNRYLEYTDKQIEFGVKEIERNAENWKLQQLSKLYYDQVVERRILFTERYERNLIKIFDYYLKKGRLELMATAATHAFLPFFTRSREAVQAQIETALSVYRHNFGRYPQGFWLPEMGWSAEVGEYLRSYTFGYTLVESHALIFADPPALKGNFYPVRTPSGVFIAGRDFYAQEDLAQMIRNPFYRDEKKDAGFELPIEEPGPFREYGRYRKGTGFKYWAKGCNDPDEEKIPPDIYDPQKAREIAIGHAGAFLDSRISWLNQASQYLEGPALSLCAWNADTFGRSWYEGPDFIEALFREGEKRKEIIFQTPGEYLYKLDASSFQTAIPEFSSWGVNGYAEMWLDSSSDWMYRHAVRAMERMTELADRFPDDSGLKERALNQAAREILLVMDSDWPKMLYNQEAAGYAHHEIETALRNFTTIYEALGSNYISTEWLTRVEQVHNLFPHINYRIFRRKR
jgi:1,4-alpha-glucan branching enzyme